MKGLTDQVTAASPLVSVVMAVFNGAQYIREAIQSILDQTLADFELILIDDGSTDESARIIEGFSDSRIRTVRNGTNRGIPYTRNLGLEMARGEFIAILDCDDLAQPERLAVQSAYLQRHQEVALVASRAAIIDGSGARTGEIWPVRVIPDAEIPPTLLFFNCIVQSTVMIRRSVAIDQRYRMDIPYSEDYELWVRLARCSRISILPGILVCYRVSSGSVSRQKALEMFKYKAHVVVEQLARLGLDADMESVKRHLGNDLNGPPRDISPLKYTDLWLKQLVALNDVVRIYPRKPLENVLSQQWREIVYRYGMKNCSDFLTFYGSRFSYGKAMMLIDLIKFPFRSIMKSIS